MTCSLDIGSFRTIRQLQLGQGGISIREGAGPHQQKGCYSGWIRPVISPEVFVGDGVVIGSNVKIQNNVSIYTGVELEDDVFCAPSCVFTNVVNPRSQIIRHDKFEATLVRRGATIGANSTIVCGATIVRYAFIGAGAVVRGDVKDYALMLGVPARQKGWMSRHGHRLTKRDDAGWLICPESGWRYAEEAGQLRCLDYPEDQSL